MSCSSLSPSSRAALCWAHVVLLPLPWILGLEFCWVSHDQLSSQPLPACPPALLVTLLRRALCSRASCCPIPRADAQPCVIHMAPALINHLESYVSKALGFLLINLYYLKAHPTGGYCPPGWVCLY